MAKRKRRGTDCFAYARNDRSKSPSCPSLGKRDVSTSKVLRRLNVDSSLRWNDSRGKRKIVRDFYGRGVLVAVAGGGGRFSPGSTVSMEPGGQPN
jgi:hypothetical protein